MSPKSGGRAQRRQRRNLWISVLVVVAISLGSFAAVFAAKWSPRLGLDLAGGVSVVYTAEGQHVSQADLDETVNILNLRVNGLGVSGAQVQTTGKNQISVSIPGVTDAQQVLDQIGQTARMYFRPVECYALSRGCPEGLEEQGVAPGHRDDSRLFVGIRTHRGQPRHQYHHRRADEQHPAGQPVRGVPVDERREARLRQQHRAPARPQRGVRRSRRALRARPRPDVGPFHRQRAGHAEPDGCLGRRLHAGGCGRLGTVGQGGPGEFPPAARDRARRRGLLGAHHPAQPDELLLVRRQG